MSDRASPAARPGRSPLAAAPSPSVARRVCICVDDYGLHSGIDGAALRLADLHRVHAISCLVGGRSWVASSRWLREFKSGSVDIGLHLDFTEAPQLGASRRALPELIVASHLRGLDRPLIRAEIQAQFDAFEQAIGHSPAFVDGHQHVHQLPVVRSELLAELQTRRGEMPPWIRSTRAPRTGHTTTTTTSPGRLKPRVIEGLGARSLAAAASRWGYPQNRHLLGVYDFQGGRSRYRELLAGWLLSASDGDLLMCHPSLATSAADPLVDARQAEFDVLSGAGFNADLHAAGVQLGPMSQMLALRR